MIVFNANGTRHCVFRTLDDGNAWTDTHIPSGFGEPVYSSPALGDVNGDGYPDIVFGSFDRHIYAIDRNCHTILDYTLADTVWSSPALYDADGDGRDEIFIGGDQSPEGLYNVAGGVFLALKWTPFFARQRGGRVAPPDSRHVLVQPRDRQHPGEQGTGCRRGRGVLLRHG